jgi:peptidoglycan/LPS O-acetylase OafA/YrhL/lysophospholipase L1-like esterase
MSGKRGIRYLPALDGLRAFAVLAVICYHGGLDWAAGGFLGVDAFFVLSGFLITSLLLAEWKSTDAIALAAFWIRRAKRLLPALFLVLIGIALYGAFAANATELTNIRADGLASLFYVANWRFVFSHQSYFDQFSAPSPLRHMWSLAIEEQFYLVWPLIVFGVLRWTRGSVRALAIVAGVIAIASATLMTVLYNPSVDPSRVYYGTDTRASSLLVGALLAMLVAKRPLGQTVAGRRALHATALISAVALGWMWTQTSDTSSFLYEGGFVLAAFLVAAVIADSTLPEPSALGRVLSIAPLRWIGMISYGLYLWHWPIYVYLNPLRTGIDGTDLFLVRVGVTFAVATASYYLVERPIRMGTWRTWSVRLAAPAAVIGVAGVLLWSTAGALPTVNISARDRAVPKSSIREQPDVPAVPRVALVGDSLANSLAPGLVNSAGSSGFQFWNASVPGCGFATEEGEHLLGDQWLPPTANCQPTWRQRWPQLISQWNPDIVVMLGAQEAFDRRIDGNVVRYDTTAGADLLRTNLTDATHLLTAGGAHVVLLTGLYGKLGWPLHIDLDRSGFNPNWIDRWDDIEREVAAADPTHVSVIDLNAYLNPDGHWDETFQGVQARSDGVHLTPEAADIAARWLVPQLLTSTVDRKFGSTVTLSPR